MCVEESIHVNFDESNIYLARKDEDDIGTTLNDDQVHIQAPTIEDHANEEERMNKNKMENKRAILVVTKSYQKT